METDAANTSVDPYSKDRPPNTWTPPTYILLCVFIFYAIPLISPSTGIQGDTADVHLPLLKYFAERLFSGRLPFWTPYLYSGYPLMANPMMGEWYPPNWILILTGVTPWGLQFQLAIHAAIACLGTYFLLIRMVKRPGPALAGAFVYGFSGFFAAHSSQLGVFMAAAWFPWLLGTYFRATEGQKTRFACLGGIVGGLIVLSGHIQTACFTFVGVLLFALGDIAAKRVPWSRAAVILGIMIVATLAVSAVQSLPSLELARVAASPPGAAMTGENAVLRSSELMTLMLPNWLGTITTAAPNLFNHSYFYAGFLLLPLALLGINVSPFRLPALALIIPTVWYVFGPDAGLYRLGVVLPGVRGGPAIGAWFLVAFGLAILASAGFDWIFSLSKRLAKLGIFATVLLFADLLYFNSIANPLAYARQDYNQRYARPESFGRMALAAPQLPLTRFDCAFPVRGAGPLLHPLDLKLEATYGYLLQESAYYREYREAMVRNAHLRDGINASRYLNLQAREIGPNPTVLPRAYFPHSLRDVNSDEESRQALEALDPSAGSIVMTPHAGIDQDPNASAMIATLDEQYYKIHYIAHSTSLLRLAVPWYPGWTATIASSEVPIVRVDHAMMGIVVPPGEYDVEFTYSSPFFLAGSIISILSAALISLIASGGSIYRSLDRSLFHDGGWKRKRHRVTGYGTA